MLQLNGRARLLLLLLLAVLVWQLAAESRAPRARIEHAWGQEGGVLLTWPHAGCDAGGLVQQLLLRSDAGPVPAVRR